MTWSRLLTGAALADFLVLIVTGVVVGDIETLAFAGIVALTTGWLVVRPNRAATVVRGLVFADVEFFMLPGFVSNIGHHEQLTSTVIPLLLAVTSGVGLIATLFVLAGRRGKAREQSFATAVAAIAAIALLSGLGVSASASASGETAQSHDIVLSIKNAKFSTADLQAQAGPVAVFITNHDLFWHTFTLDDLHVDVRVPVGGHRRVVLTLSPGRYEFHCAIPGHAAIGMRGTLTVR